MSKKIIIVAGYLAAGKGGVVALMKVQGIDAMYQVVTGSGWQDISPVESQSWGARMCRVTTPDGYVLQFFE